MPYPFSLSGPNMIHTLRVPTFGPDNSITGTTQISGKAPDLLNKLQGIQEQFQNAFSNPSSQVSNFVSSLSSNPTMANAVNAFGSSMTPAQENFLASNHAYQAQVNGLSQPYDVWRQQTGIPTFMGAHSQIPGELHPTIYTPGQLQLIGAVNNAIA